uniref:Uncharacterized protein n=1 Tax=Vespula pensylvanica TaxID=30213 RepID=A0A834NQZ1_VESPE|nr:hypothetical protein H0235_012438 [Vespula pensylvanica]
MCSFTKLEYKSVLMVTQDHHFSFEKADTKGLTHDGDTSAFPNPVTPLGQFISERCLGHHTKLLIGTI